MTAMTQTQTEPCARTRFLNLGELTDALAALPETTTAFVMMGGELFSPDGVDTGRAKNLGLAIEPVNPTYRRTVGDLLGCLREANGKSRIHRGTGVCVSRYTDPPEDYVTGVEVRSGTAVVMTERAVR